jgi:hypothetical protein
MVLMLAWMAIWLSEAVIQRYPTAAGHVWEDAVEDALGVLILVEASIDKFPQKAAAL